MLPMLGTMAKVQTKDLIPTAKDLVPEATDPRQA